MAARNDIVGLQVYKREWAQERYQRNPELGREKARLWRMQHPHAGRIAAKKFRNRQRAIIDQLKAKPCTDCGMSYLPCVMEFDHIRGSKLFNIGKTTSRRLTDILAEIDKCELVCANCHKIREHKRRLENLG